MAVSLAQDAAAQIITTYAGPAAPVNGLPATNYAIGVPHSVRLDGANGYFVLTDYRIYHVSSDGGLHLVGWLAGHRDDGAVAKSALRQGVHVWPLSTHYLRPEHKPALLLGYAGTTTDDMRYGINILSRVLR